MDDVRTKEEIIKLVKRIMDHDGTEEEIPRRRDCLSDRFPHPEVLDFVF
ncbi:hypothetical protein [Polycladomyces subterraneus]|uniref:DEK C-terminal domain-containing protein n=1 Tax=Polycladomyces subterraneus TaxID=1016997 RepID=A0ABT8IK19_9BACL|nr:hypothetical protein [Polycladomyces subterraneus]MDN4593133.1 hypothetical protein [Polycladomyces subterraneus]